MAKAITHVDSLAELLKQQGLVQGVGDGSMLVEPVGQEGGDVGVDVLLVSKPQVGPEVDLSKVDLVVSNVLAEVLAGDACPSITGVVLHICVVLAPETLITDGDQVVGVDAVSVVGHHLHPGLQNQNASHTKNQTDESHNAGHSSCYEQHATQHKYMYATATAKIDSSKQQFTATSKLDKQSPASANT